MDLQYDFYGIGIDAGEAGQSVPLEQTVFLASGALLRHVVSGLYVGGQILWLTTTVTPQDSAGPASRRSPARTELWREAFERNSIPGTATTGPSGDRWRSSREFLHTNRAIRLFPALSGGLVVVPRTTGPGLVLATNLLACGRRETLLSTAVCSLGSGRFSVRGYTQGRYRDHYTTAVQVELRGHTAGRLGAVLFGGFGQVAPEASEILGAELLPAGGAGLRYQLVRKYPMHLRLDYAWGRDGGVLYFSVGEPSDEPSRAQDVAAPGDDAGGRQHDRHRCLPASGEPRLGGLDCRFRLAGRHCRRCRPGAGLRQAGRAGPAGRRALRLRPGLSRPYVGFQTNYVYWFGNWIGNIAIAVAAVGYLASSFPGSRSRRRVSSPRQE